MMLNNKITNEINKSLIWENKSQNQDFYANHLRLWYCRYQEIQNNGMLFSYFKKSIFQFLRERQPKKYRHHKEYIYKISGISRIVLRLSYKKNIYISPYCIFYLFLLIDVKQQIYFLKKSHSSKMHLKKCLNFCCYVSNQHL